MGWFDAVASRYGVRMQGATQVSLTVLDVLGYLDELPICVGYEIDGKITREEAVKHPDKNMVTKGIGNSKLVEPDVIHKKFKDGDTILMCTDGLTNMVSEERIKEILKEEGDVSKKLTDEANKNGGMDNITVVVIRK